MFLILDIAVSRTCSLVQTLANRHILCVFFSAVGLSSIAPGEEKSSVGVANLLTKDANPVV